MMEQTILVPLDPNEEIAWANQIAQLKIFINMNADRILDLQAAIKANISSIAEQNSCPTRTRIAVTWRNNTLELEMELQIKEELRRKMALLKLTRPRDTMSSRYAKTARRRRTKEEIERESKRDRAYDSDFVGQGKSADRGDFSDVSIESLHNELYNT
jgi:hypothetical protein